MKDGDSKIRINYCNYLKKRIAPQFIKSLIRLS